MTKHESLQPLTDGQREELQAAMEQYSADLDHYTGQASDLLDQRMIDGYARNMFRLGVVGDPLPGHEAYKGWLAIPYLGPDNQCFGMRFRCPENHEHRGHGKYMSLPGHRSRVFNVRDIESAAHEIHVTEGELDAVILGATLGVPVIGFPGASNWRTHHAIMLAGFNRIWVWGDPDPAGRKFSNEILSELRVARSVPLTGGDVNEVYTIFGVEELQEAFQKASEI